jgi:CDP-diacylglycerol--glycerol-3-phosphate 3-phosphatidyltransferase
MPKSPARSRSGTVPPAEAEETPTDMLGRFWTIPNALSLLRMAVVVPITALVWTDGSLEWLFGLIVFGAMTDFLDGRVARWSHAVSGWGKVLDPMADKFAAVMVISALTFRGVEPTLPLWFFAVVMTRDLLILAGGMLIARQTGRVAQSGALGKAAVASLALTVLYAILGADPAVLDYCVWFSTALLVGSFLIYLGRYAWVERTGGLPEQAQRESTPLREEREEAGRQEFGGEKSPGTSSSGTASSQKEGVSETSHSKKQAAPENGVPRPS